MLISISRSSHTFVVLLVPPRGRARCPNTDRCTLCLLSLLLLPEQQQQVLRCYKMKTKRRLHCYSRTNLCHFQHSGISFLQRTAFSVRPASAGAPASLMGQSSLDLSQLIAELLPECHQLAVLRHKSISWQTQRCAGC